MTDWFVWLFIALAAGWALRAWLGRADDPDVIERFKHWRP